ncbi:TetR/AcrR family transcriptional regulator [Streptomyces xantholiticus]|uniref:TetR/AcrR family transcriptional regulator n=1 Tax=Streptomyces xantholiticus TaxID=68285 RepID=UPI0016730C89|nr:TetR/AcrR family transcriptional regulator [Streptomyces xantholiticus]GGW71326.1 putative transcriptional regulator, TetR family protein [Streptomyces xantholiticus]
MPSPDSGTGQPAQPRPAGTRTRRGKRTHDALVAAARRIFERDGYLDARIVDIAAEAKVATGSFYTHFSSKEDVFAAVLERLRDEMLHAGVSDGGDGERKDLWRGVEDANRAYLESYRRNAGLMAAMEQAAAVDPQFVRMRLERSRVFIDRSAAAIARLQQSGLADPELDPDVTARALSAMVSRLAYATFALGEAVPFDTLVETVTKLWTNALCMPRD